MDLFVKKPIADLLREADTSDREGMRRVLGPWGVVALGIGVIIGAGLFSITGIVAGEHTGPAIAISFLIAAIGCSFAGLCYAEFASMLPIAGSAYTYSYATMGELIAWIIGWDLVLEYSVAAVSVSISWSRYFIEMLNQLGLPAQATWTMCPTEGGILNLPAMAIVVVLSILLARGTQGSARFNDFIVVLKLLIVAAFVGLGAWYMRAENLTPFIPENTGTFGAYGWSGILRGAAILFYAYIGFDAVSTAAQETINPRRNMPIGILGSLGACTLIYVVASLVMVGVVDYHEYIGMNSIAPAVTAVSHMGPVAADGTITPAVPWLGRAIVIAILLGYASVIMVVLLGQSRVFYSMSRDGLLPGFFSHLHKRFRTPARSNMLFMVVIALLAGLVPADVAGEMVSIGTLFAFTLVCAGVLVVRRTMPDAPRGFKTPWVPFTPLMGILLCGGMMLFLPAETWIRLVIWMLLGLDVYALYSVRHSLLGGGTHRRHGQSLLSVLGTILSLVCIIVAFWHQETVGWHASRVLFYISVAFGVFHIVFHAVRFRGKTKQ